MHERYSKTYKPQPTFDLFFNVFMFLMTIVSDVSRVFLGKAIHTSNLRKYHWHQADKFSKFVPSDTLKMHSLTLSVLIFLSIKHFHII